MSRSFAVMDMGTDVNGFDHSHIHDVDCSFCSFAANEDNNSMLDKSLGEIEALHTISDNYADQLVALQSIHEDLLIANRDGLLAFNVPSLANVMGQTGMYHEAKDDDMLDSLVPDLRGTRPPMVEIENLSDLSPDNVRHALGTLASHTHALGLRVFRLINFVEKKAVSSTEQKTLFLKIMFFKQWKAYSEQRRLIQKHTITVWKNFHMKKQLLNNTATIMLTNRQTNERDNIFKRWLRIVRTYRQQDESLVRFDSWMSARIRRNFFQAWKLRKAAVVSAHETLIIAKRKRLSRWWEMYRSAFFIKRAVSLKRWETDVTTKIIENEDKQAQIEDQLEYMKEQFLRNSYRIANRQAKYMNLQIKIQYFSRLRHWCLVGRGKKAERAALLKEYNDGRAGAQKTRIFVSWLTQSHKHIEKMNSLKRIISRFHYSNISFSFQVWLQYSDRIAYRNETFAQLAEIHEKKTIHNVMQLWRKKVQEEKYQHTTSVLQNAYYVKNMTQKFFRTWSQSYKNRQLERTTMSLLIRRFSTKYEWLIENVFVQWKQMMHFTTSMDDLTTIYLRSHQRRMKQYVLSSWLQQSRLNVFERRNRERVIARLKSHMDLRNQTNKFQKWKNITVAHKHVRQAMEKKRKRFLLLAIRQWQAVTSGETRHGLEQQNAQYHDEIGYQKRKVDDLLVVQNDLKEQLDMERMELKKSLRQVELYKAQALGNIDVDRVLNDNIDDEIAHENGQQLPIQSRQPSISSNSRIPSRAASREASRLSRRPRERLRSGAPSPSNFERPRGSINSANIRPGSSLGMRPGSSLGSRRQVPTGRVNRIDSIPETETLTDVIINTI